MLEIRIHHTYPVTACNAETFDYCSSKTTILVATGTDDQRDIHGEPITQLPDALGRFVGTVINEYNFGSNSIHRLLDASEQRFDVLRLVLCWHHNGEFHAHTLLPG